MLLTHKLSCVPQPAALSSAGVSHHASVFLARVPGPLGASWQLSSREEQGTEEEMDFQPELKDEDLIITLSIHTSHMR